MTEIYPKELTSIEQHLVHPSSCLPNVRTRRTYLHDSPLHTWLVRHSLGRCNDTDAGAEVQHSKVTSTHSGRPLMFTDKWTYVCVSRVRHLISAHQVRNSHHLVQVEDLHTRHEQGETMDHSYSEHGVGRGRGE
mgnify:CR=1